MNGSVYRTVLQAEWTTLLQSPKWEFFGRSIFSRYGFKLRSGCSYLHFMITFKIKHSPFFFPELSSNGTKRHGIHFQIILSFWKTPSVTPNSELIQQFSYTENTKWIRITCTYLLCTYEFQKTRSRITFNILDLQHNFSHLPNTY